jgi:hypothetical protein
MNDAFINLSFLVVERTFVHVHKLMIAFDVKLMSIHFLLQAYFLPQQWFWFAMER